MESPWSRPLTNLQSAWGLTPPDGGYGDVPDLQAQQHGSAESHDPASGATPGGLPPPPQAFTINLRSVGIDSQSFRRVEKGGD